MISEGAKAVKTMWTLEQGFLVSLIHADVIDHISLTRTKSHGPNVTEIESACGHKRERNGIC